MNKRTLILILCLSVTACCILPEMALAAKAKARSGKTPPAAVTVNPLGLFFGMLDVQYETRLNNAASFPIHGGIGFMGISGWSYTSFGAGAGYRMYFEPTALEKFYWGPLANIMFVSYKYDNAGFSGSSSTVVIAPGCEIGHQWIFDNNFVVDAGAAAYLYIGSGSSLTVKTSSGASSSQTMNAYSGLGIGLRLGLGFALN